MGVRGGMLGGAGVVALLWAAQVRPSARLDALFATAAHLTGLLAGYGVLVLLFLMARVPAVEHGVGADRLARWHALGGRHVLLLCFGHALFALCGYAAHQGVDVVSAVRELFGYPAVAAAFAGTALLAAVGVSSARAVRRRVSHETWRGVHLLVHLAASLAFGHQLAGPDLALAGWFWALAHATVAVLLLWYRAVVPVRQALRHALRVGEVRVEGPGVVSVVVYGEHLAELRAEPGQFLRWRFLQRRLWHTALPFSLSAPVQGRALRITVKALGGHSRRIRRLRPGTRVIATGPFGALTAARRTRPKVLLIAGGVGITPMRALFETLPGGPGRSPCSTGPGPRSTSYCGPSWRPSPPSGRPGCTTCSGPRTPGAPPSGSWGRSAGPAGAARAGAGPGRARRVPLRAAGDGRGHAERAAAGRGAGRTHPFRVLQLLTPTCIREAAAPCAIRCTFPRPYRSGPLHSPLPFPLPLPLPFRRPAGRRPAAASRAGPPRCGRARPRWPPYRPRDGSRPGWGWPVCWPRPC